jgi:hypothetical protein
MLPPNFSFFSFFSILSGFEPRQIIEALPCSLKTMHNYYNISSQNSKLLVSNIYVP